MIGRCVGGHWPPLRLGNVQMVDKRCAEVAPQGTFSCPSGNSPCRALRETFIVIHSYLLPPNSSLE